MILNNCDIIKNQLPSETLQELLDDTNHIALIIHRLSEMPWTTQEQILNELGIEKEELIKLNEIIRRSRIQILYFLI